jgi:hypothetical protein
MMAASDLKIREGVKTHDDKAAVNSAQSAQDE